MHRLARRATFAIPAALLLVAAAAGPSIAVDKWVTMYANEYRPAAVTITPGDTVTWVSDDDVPHDAVGNGWGTPMLNKGDSHAVTFSRAGTYRFTCTIHPAMSGRVNVRAAGGPGSTTPPTDAGLTGLATASGPELPIGLALLVALTAFALALGQIRRRSLG